MRVLMGWVMRPRVGARGGAGPRTAYRAALCALICLALCGALSSGAGERERHRRQLEEQVVALSAEVEDKRAQVAAIEKSIADIRALGRTARMPLAALEHARADMLAGRVALAGPGVRVTLDDALNPDALGMAALGIVHDIDVLRVVNALCGAGAEAISINGVRLVGNTRIRCGGPTISVRDDRLAPPFVISAIGDAQALERALAQAPPGEGTLLEEITAFGVRMGVARVERLEVPAYTRDIVYRYARVRVNEESIDSEP